MSPEKTPSLTAAREDDKGKFLISAINGTILYVLAYYFVMAIHQIVKMAVSHYYHLRGTWDVSRIVYSLDDAEWWRTAIIAVNGIGPVACAVVAYATYKWYWEIARAKRGLFKLLIIWIALHAVNAVLGAALADTFTQSGFWYVAAWLFMSQNMAGVVFAVLGGIGQLIIGFLGAAAFLQAHDSKSLMRFKNRRHMVVYTLIIPWLVGSLVIGVLKYPYFSLQEGLRLAVMSLLITPMALGCLSEVYGSTVRRPYNTRIGWTFLILLVLLVVGWRMALSPPIVFGVSAATP